MDSFVNDGVCTVEAALFCGGFLEESYLSLCFHEVGLKVDPCFVTDGCVVPCLTRVEEDSCCGGDHVYGVNGVSVADGPSAVRHDFF